MACSSLLSEDNIRRFRTKPCRRNRQSEGACEFGPDRCQYSHSDQWVRRCPFYLTDPTSIRYIPKMCPDVILKDVLTITAPRLQETALFDNGEGGRCTQQDPVHHQGRRKDSFLCDKGDILEEMCQTRGKEGLLINKCRRGGSCPFAHSIEEVLYHPLVYKTRHCKQFLHGECTTYYCPFVHGTAEARDVSSLTYQLPFTQDIFQSSPFPNVRITGKINSKQAAGRFENYDSQRGGGVLKKKISGIAECHHSPASGLEAYGCAISKKSTCSCLGIQPTKPQSSTVSSSLPDQQHSPRPSYALSDDRLSSAASRDILSIQAYQYLQRDSSLSLAAAHGPSRHIASVCPAVTNPVQQNAEFSCRDVGEDKLHCFFNGDRDCHSTSTNVFPSYRKDWVSNEATESGDGIKAISLSRAPKVLQQGSYETSALSCERVKNAFQPANKGPTLKTATRDEPHTPPTRMPSTGYYDMCFNSSLCSSFDDGPLQTGLLDSTPLLSGVRPECEHTPSALSNATQTSTLHDGFMDSESLSPYSGQPTASSQRYRRGCAGSRVHTATALALDQTLLQDAVQNGAHIREPRCFSPLVGTREKWQTPLISHSMTETDLKNNDALPNFCTTSIKGVNLRFSEQDQERNSSGGLSFLPPSTSSGFWLPLAQMIYENGKSDNLWSYEAESFFSKPPSYHLSRFDTLYPSIPSFPKAGDASSLEVPYFGCPQPKAEAKLVGAVSAVKSFEGLPF